MFLILIKCIAAAVEHSAEHSSDTTGIANSAEAAVMPAIRGICGVCERELPASHTDAEGAQPGTTTYSSDLQCPLCGANILHLVCALQCPSQIMCRNCGQAIYCRTAGLDSFIQQLRHGDLNTMTTGAHRRALDVLKPIGRNLMIMTLCAYDMSNDELNLLSEIALSAGADYQEVVETIRHITEIKDILRAPTGKIIARLTNMQTLATGLLILEIAIMPHFIAEANEEQVIALVELLARYREVSAHASGALLRKIVDLIDTVGSVLFGNNDIKRILQALISRGSCAMIKHMVGRYRFSHQFTYNDTCFIIEQYTTACTYSDETFIPLLIFLVNGNAGAMASKYKIRRLADMLLQRNSNICNTDAYKKMQRMAEKCEQDSVCTVNAVASYVCAFDSSDFNLSEDIFCAILGIWDAKKIPEFLMKIIQFAGNAHIIRHIPISWMQVNIDVCINIAKQAMTYENCAMLEEILIAFINTKQPSRNMRCLFEDLLQSNCRDYVGIILKTVSSRKLRYLKDSDISDWLLEQLVSHKVYWCIPYFKKQIRDKKRYGQVLCQHRREIMNTAATGELRLSPLFREIVRYDARNTFFIENIQEYLEALLRVSTDKYVIMRLLVKMCVTRPFDHVVVSDKMEDIYELLKMQQEFIFYLDVLYYALQHRRQKSCLKALIMDDLECMAAKNSWALASMDKGALYRRKGFKRCRGNKCTNSKCRYCEIVYNVALRDLLAALWYARANQ